MTGGAFTVVCTGRGTHKRRIFNEVTITGGDIQVRATRVANMPEFKGGTIDGIQVEHKAILPASYDPRAGHNNWRWKCPLCPVDQRLSSEGLRAWLERVARQGRRVADISQIV